jgi:hypothetical protein
LFLGEEDAAPIARFPLERFFIQLFQLLGNGLV